ncbi:MAG: hypothetical protein P1U69_13825 [Parvibaculaceae bacterium]|nr:hypothetical protein [Parvibaculaceae bacterium]
MGFRRGNGSKPNGRSQEEIRRYEDAIKPDDRNTWQTVEQIKAEAFQGAADTFYERSNKDEDLHDLSRAKTAEIAARKSQFALERGPSPRQPKGWPTRVQFLEGTPLPPDDGSEIEYE